MEKSEVERLKKLLNETALPWLNETDDEQWQLHSGKDRESGVVYRCSVTKYGTIFKAQIVLPCSAAAAYETIVKHGDDSWMPNLALTCTLEQQDDWDVIYQAAKGQGGISDREFYTFRCFGEDSEKGFYYALGRSITKVPKYNFTSPYKKMVRGENLPAGFSWRQLDNPDQCLFTKIYNVDLKVCL